MNVIRAKTAGFCMGVSLALHLLDNALKNHAQNGARSRLITLGPVIHNPRVIREYEKKGVLCLDDPALVHKGDTVLIRAHGVPKSVESALRRQHATLLDATCPKVKQAQLAIVAERTANGGILLLFGEADHPEVRGLVSYAENDALVFSSLEELAALPINPKGRYYLAAQTTQDVEAFSAIKDWLQNYLALPLPVLETICDATRKRQEEAILLAQRTETVIVIGGSNSGNTRRLAEVVASQGTRAIRIEDSKELPLEHLRDIRIIGLTAGASTPAEHIDAVHALLDTV